VEIDLHGYKVQIDEDDYDRVIAYCRASKELHGAYGRMH